MFLTLTTTTLGTPPYNLYISKKRIYIGYTASLYIVICALIMGCPGVLRMNLRPCLASRLPIAASIRPARRHFFDLPGTEVIKLSESRILPYKPDTLYTIISDVDKYKDFIPYCQKSRVTKWSSPDKDGRKWPEEADLKVGWGGFEETYTSKLFCVPGSIIEALGGDAKTTLSKAQLSHHSQASIDAPATSNAMFKKMATKWSVNPSGPDRTKVDLDIEFQFSNPLYGAVSKAVAPKLAETMIEAFEKRAQAVLGSEGRATQGSANPFSR